MSLYRAELLRWIDGDTLDCIVDLRHGLSRHVRVRLAGVAAPETRGPQRPLGLITLEWVRRTVMMGSQIGLEDFGSREEDAFGRWLCRVHHWPVHPDRPVDIGHELLRRGYAIPYADRKDFDWPEEWPREV